MSQSLPPESSPKENKFYLQLSLSPMSVTGTTVMQMPLSPMSVNGTTVRWLLHHGRRESLLGAITAFWSPLAVLEQNPDPMWAKGQALLSIGRLQHQILLLQQTFDIKPFEAQLPVPVLSATPSFPVVAQREDPKPVIPTPPSSVPSD